MRRKVALVAALCLALAANSPAREKKDKQAEGLALIERARKLSDIRASGSPPFRLRATVLLYIDGKPVQGENLLIWVSPNEWREEITFPGFLQVEVRRENMRWMRRSLNFRPWWSYQLQALFDVENRLQVIGKEKTGRLEERTKEGRRLHCVDVHRKGWKSTEFCFDTSTGTLARWKFWTGDSWLRDEYADPIVWTNKAFPRVLQRFEDDRPLLDVKIEDLQVGINTALSWFEPPQDAEVWEDCEHPEPARLLEKPPLQYPSGPTWRLRPTVSVYGVVGTDGQLHNLTVIRSGGTLADAATLDNLKRWRFKPKMCDGKPVPEENVIHIQ